MSKKDKGKFDSLWSKSKCKTCFGGPKIDNDSEWFLKNYFVWYFKGVCLFVHFLKLEVSLLQDFERHRYVTLSWIEGNTETFCQYPQKISPQAATYFVKSKSWPKDTSTGSENSVDLVLFGSDSEKHYLPNFDSEMRTSFTYEWFFYEIKENWDQSVHRRHSNVWSGCFCSTHETVDFVRDYSFQQTSRFLPFRTEGDSVIIPTSVQHVQVGTVGWFWESPLLSYRYLIALW